MDFDLLLHLQERKSERGVIGRPEDPNDLCGAWDERLKTVDYLLNLFPLDRSVLSNLDPIHDDTRTGNSRELPVGIYELTIDTERQGLETIANDPRKHVGRELKLEVH
jgi:hypothetical protein